MKEKEDIRLLTLNKLGEFCKKNNLPVFRAKQIWQWLWKKRASSFEEMTSLSKETRKLLHRYFSLRPIKIYAVEKSRDGTIKYSFQLHDKLLIEGVLIPSKKRVTACLSSQAGCSLDCSFCATGKLKLERNLSAAEIYDQVFILNQESVLNFARPISNIVYMGMGEPLLNYKHVLNSVALITSDIGLAMSPKRITISTAGIAKMIKRLADDDIKFNLAISLHSSSDKKRDLLMPLNKNINLAALTEAVEYFFKKTGRRITYEYILFHGVNDNIEDAQELARFTRAIPCKINLIEYNRIESIPYQKSSNRNTDRFMKALEEKNIVVNLRRSKGKDIAAACGQLANKLN